MAPVVLVSAAGLLFSGIQAKNLHLSDRIRALAAELRNPATTAERRRQVTEQLPCFDRRIRLSQRALQVLQLAILCFVLTSLLLAAALWAGASALPPVAILFAAGVALLVAALVLEFVEMSLGLRTVDIELRDVARDTAGRP